MAVDLIPFCRMKLHDDFIIRSEQLLDETHFRPIRAANSLRLPKHVPTEILPMLGLI